METSPSQIYSVRSSIAHPPSGSGFIALHIILQLLNKGYPVRTTVRSLSREAQLKQALSNNGVTNVDSLQVVAANLEKDEGWVDAAKGCSYVLHVASPFPDYAPKHEDELIKPAREGTLRVLRAAKAASVKRVVVTSSFAAIGYGPYQPGHVFTEKDWTPSNDAKNVGAYARSKTIAEEAAWKYVKDENEPFELATVNPVAVTGPVLDPSTRISTSLTMVQKMLSGGAPMVPHMQIGIVDVRDVADLHLRAMTDPKANGERFLCITGQPMFMKVRFLQSLSN